ncbi:MAG: ABC transporter substrate-binding protein [Alphaproteobacteria bacterium]
MTIKKILIPLVLIVVIILGWNNQTKKSNTQSETSSKPVIKIGATLPITGNLGLFGTTMKKGMKLAIEELNSNPNNTFTYKLFAENNEMTSKLARNNALKLINVEKVNVIFTAFALPAKTIEKIAEANKVIAFHTTLGGAPLDGKYGLNNFPTGTSEGQKLIEFINKNNYKNIAVISVQLDGLLEVKAELKKRLPKEKYQIYNILPDERHASITVAKIKEQSPDLIVALTMPPITEIFSKEMMLQKISTPIVGIEFYNNSPELFKVLSDYHTIGIGNGSEEYMKKYGGRTYWSVFGYDDVNIISQAYESLGLVDGKIPNSEAVLEKLHEIKNFKGEVGNLVLDERGQFHSTPILMRVKNGKEMIIND